MHYNKSLQQVNVKSSDDIYSLKSVIEICDNKCYPRQLYIITGRLLASHVCKLR